MKSDSSKFNIINQNNTSIISIKSQNKKKRTRKKIFWSEREEKTLFILQMALGTKFSIIKTFIKDKTANDIKNHFYSKLRTYLSIQLSKLKSENFFKDIDPNSYKIKKILSLVLSNKIPTMILNKNIIKELILNEEQKKKNKKEGNIFFEDGDKKEKKLGKKRGRPSKKSLENKNTISFKVKIETGNNNFGKISKNENIEDKKFIFDNIINNNNNSIEKEKLNQSKITVELNESDIPNFGDHFNF